MYVVETSSGTIHTGLLVERNDKVVVLKDAKNQPQSIPAGDIEGMFPQTKSFMPEMLLRDFTAQQAADLLEYLSSLKSGPDPPPSTEK
jgi:putative heme-binding domain-containing protein